MSDSIADRTGVAIREYDKRIAELEAARIAYASEFDGDVGRIHENIRKLKAENERLREASGFFLKISNNPNSLSRWLDACVAITEKAIKSRE